MKKGEKCEGEAREGAEEEESWRDAKKHGRKMK